MVPQRTDSTAVFEDMVNAEQTKELEAKQAALSSYAH